jgi:hypothetical protein
LKHWQDTASGDDWVLAHELERTRSAVLATNIELTTNLHHGRTQFIYHLPYDLFALALGDFGTLGNVVTQPDRDGQVRRTSLAFDKFEGMAPFSNSFGLRVVEKAWSTRAVPNPDGRLFLSDRFYPQTFRLNFVGPSGTVKTVPLWRVLDNGTQQPPDKRFAANAAALALARELRDTTS